MTSPPTGQANRLLGYPPDARLLIINADDFGMCHAVNAAVTAALENGVARSASLMTPCAWARHGMRYLTAHPQTSFGVHLTAISEWADYRWGPLMPRQKVPTLLDAAGYFPVFDAMHDFLARIDLAELESEFRAQIECVLDAGLQPAHLDWHALRIGGRQDIFELMLRLAREYGLALRVMGQSSIEQVQRMGLPCSDRDFLDSYMLGAVEKTARFVRLLRELPPGLSEWAVHPGIDTPELLAIEPGEARIRQADFDFLVSPTAKEVIAQEGILLLDYKALQAVWRG